MFYFVDVRMFSGALMIYLFVYYKFKPKAYPSAARDANELIAAIEKSVPGVRARLLMRPDISSAGEHTWMETYELETDHKTLLEQRLSELVADSGLPDGRRLEWFVEL